MELRAVRDDEIDAAAFLALKYGGARREAHRHKTHAREAPLVQIRRELLAVEPRRADNFKRRIGSPPHRHVRRLKQPDARIQSRLRQAAHVGRRVDPRLSRPVEPHRAPPTLHLHDAQVATYLSLLVEETREFADGHAVANRDHVIAREGEFIGVGHRSLRFNAADGVRAVEHVDGNFRARRFFHDVAERGDVCVEARADILNIEDERVELFQVLGLRSARLAVERIDRQSGLLVLRVRDFVVNQTAYAVLRRKERDEFDVRRFAQHVNRRSPATVAPGVVRHQPDAQPRELFEPVALKHVNAV